MSGDSGLLAKINRAFLLQAALISIGALLSVFVAKVVLEEVLIKEAIQQEADYFWENFTRDPSFNLPDTLNLTGFLESGDVPEGVRDLAGDANGFYEYDDDEQRLVVHVSSRDRHTLYLLYNRGQVDSLAAFYGLFPLALVLIVLYLLMWLTYVFSRRALSPLTRLAREVDEIDFDSPDLSSIEVDETAFDSNDEIKVLTDAIHNLGQRLNAFIDRERNFTRDASHELRSPLTVIKIATDMLQSEQSLPKPMQNSVARIERAVQDMEELTSAFLLLARESDQALSAELVCINELIQEEIERVRLLAEDKQLDINCTSQCRLETHASDKVLSVLFGNLIRNAMMYTEEGGIEITITADSVVIEDSGKGIAEQQVKQIFKPYYRADEAAANGHGVGLTIVKRLSDRFNWPIGIESTPGVGTRITVTFPECRAA